ncbi:MAG: hypothetical protein P4L54_10100 [Acidocella sp.]|jgi:hypothetical protein|nr:hypothetical protein [Acidocella sp.]
MRIVLPLAAVLILCGQTGIAFAQSCTAQDLANKSQTLMQSVQAMETNNPAKAKIQEPKIEAIMDSFQNDTPDQMAKLPPNQLCDDYDQMIKLAQ